MADNREKIDAHRARYLSAAKRMQTGVAFDMGRSTDTNEQAHKHLRVGVNVALSDQGALAALLIRKGVIAEEEYAGAIADAMEAEAQKYQDRLERRYGISVTLGEAGFGADPE